MVVIRWGALALFAFCSISQAVIPDSTLNDVHALRRLTQDLSTPEGDLLQLTRQIQNWEESASDAPPYTEGERPYYLALLAELSVHAIPTVASAAKKVLKTVPNRPAMGTAAMLQLHSIAHELFLQKRTDMTKVIPLLPFYFIDPPKEIAGAGFFKEIVALGTDTQIGSEAGKAISLELRKAYALSLAIQSQRDLGQRAKLLKFLADPDTEIKAIVATTLRTVTYGQRMSVEDLAPLESLITESDATTRRLAMEIAGGQRFSNYSHERDIPTDKDGISVAIAMNLSPSEPREVRLAALQALAGMRTMEPTAQTEALAIYQSPESDETLRTAAFTFLEASLMGHPEAQRMLLRAYTSDTLEATTRASLLELLKKQLKICPNRLETIALAIELYQDSHLRGHASLAEILGGFTRARVAYVDDKVKDATLARLRALSTDKDALVAAAAQRGVLLAKEKAPNAQNDEQTRGEEGELQNVSDELEAQLRRVAHVSPQAAMENPVLARRSLEILKNKAKSPTVKKYLKTIVAMHVLLQRYGKIRSSARLSAQHDMVLVNEMFEGLFEALRFAVGADRRQLHLSQPEDGPADLRAAEIKEAREALLRGLGIHTTREVVLSAILTLRFVEPTRRSFTQIESSWTWGREAKETIFERAYHFTLSRLALWGNRPADDRLNAMWAGHPLTAEMTAQLRGALLDSRPVLPQEDYEQSENQLRPDANLSTPDAAEPTGTRGMNRQAGASSVGQTSGVDALLQMLASPDNQRSSARLLQDTAGAEDSREMAAKLLVPLAETGLVTEALVAEAALSVLGENSRARTEVKRAAHLELRRASARILLGMSTQLKAWDPVNHPHGATLAATVAQGLTDSDPVVKAAMAEVYRVMQSGKTREAALESFREACAESVSNQSDRKRK